MLVVAGIMSGLLGFGSGARQSDAMDYFMHLPLQGLECDQQLYDRRDGGRRGAGGFLARGDVPTRRGDGRARSDAPAHWLEQLLRMRRRELR